MDKAWGNTGILTVGKGKNGIIFNDSDMCSFVVIPQTNILPSLIHGMYLGI